MPTTEEIYDSIIAEKESGNYPELDALDSTSKVAIWRLWAWIAAFASKSVHELFESLKSFLADLFAKSQVGTIEWWTENVKKWQSGDFLEFLDGIWKYAIVDELKYVVTQVALENLGGVLLFKVAKDDSGSLTALDAPEQTALLAYINKIKLPGTNTSVISFLGDDLKLNYKIYYDAQLSEQDIRDKVLLSAQNYLSNIVFNGKFQHTELTDEFQKIEGVKFPIFET